MTFANDDNNDEEMNSALHVAFDLKNSRSIDILLRYMAKTTSDSSRNFRRLFPHLVERAAFQSYLDRLAFQTVNMKQKQILKIDEPLNETVVKLGYSTSKYVDSNLFKRCLDEDPNNKDYHSFPVDVVALRIQWILMTPEGKLFLDEVVKQPNLEIYGLKSIQILVEFFFDTIRKRILRRQLPLFICQVIFFGILVFSNE